MAEASALMFVADPKANRVWTRSGLGLTRRSVREVGGLYHALLAGGGPHGVIAQLAGKPREVLLAEQAELRRCWRQMGWVEKK